MIIFAVILAATATLFVVWPLLRSGTDAPDREAAALAIYVDQLAEVDRDAARGQISQPDAEAARTEIKRRMLAASRAKAKATRTSGGVILMVMALLVPLGGAAIYMQTGSPSVPSQPYADRTDERDEASELETLITRLRTQLEGAEDGGETRGWGLLAATYMNMNRFKDASVAFEQIINRPDAISGTWSQYAESLIAAENGIVTPKAAGAIEKALQLDPTNPAGTYYGALALEQSGQSALGRQNLIDRINSETGYLPWMDAFAAEINRMGQTLNVEPFELAFSEPKGPSQEDIDAASEMTAQEQQEFIASMVDRLAARLKDDPTDIEGWIQLARAYMVLERPADALSALESARPITNDLPEDNPLRRSVEAGISQLSN